MFIFIFFAYNIVMVHSFIKMLKKSQDSNRHIALLTQSRQSRTTVRQPFVPVSNTSGVRTGTAAAAPMTTTTTMTLADL